MDYFHYAKIMDGNASVLNIQFKHWETGGIFGAKMRDFREKSGISREKMRDFGVQGGIFGVDVFFSSKKWHFRVENA